MSILQDAGIRKNVLVYLAVPPHVFGETTGAIRRARQALDSSEITRSSSDGWFRVVLEKPFGRDLDTCNTLLAELEAQKSENAKLKGDVRILRLKIKELEDKSEQAVKEKTLLEE